MTGQHVVMFSSGAGSWAAAKRVAAEHGTDDLVLLFADTNTEDEDNYRFLREAAADIGGELVVLDNGGRDVWDVFTAKRFIGNTRVDVCSATLKRRPMRAWLAQHCDTAATVVYLGYGWDEAHRMTRARPRWEPWTVRAPMCEPPYLMKDQVLSLIRAAGIEPPRLYAQGFPHANCGGFCVKAGQAQFRHLLLRNRDRYLAHEVREEELRAQLGKDVAVMRDRTGGAVTPLTMREFRGRLDSQPAMFEDDWGGCGCIDGQDDLPSQIGAGT